MRIEIERKYLVTSEEWKPYAQEAIEIKQGYLATTPAASIRIRTMGTQAVLTIKQARPGIHRAEFEYPVPVDDAETMLRILCIGTLVQKTRYKVPWQGMEWEIDVFHGENAGLVIAEIELEDETGPVPIPPWVGREVSGEHRYYNSSLSRTPFRQWPENNP